MKLISKKMPASDRFLNNFINSIYSLLHQIHKHECTHTTVLFVIPVLDLDDTHLQIYQKYWKILFSPYLMESPSFESRIMYLTIDQNSTLYTLLFNFADTIKKTIQSNQTECCVSNVGGLSDLLYSYKIDHEINNNQLKLHWIQ